MGSGFVVAGRQVLLYINTRIIYSLNYEEKKMAKTHKPVSGSRAFWPRKRAARIYPRIKSHPSVSAEKVAPLDFAGYKAGMTQVTYIDSAKDSATQGQEITEAVTVLDCPSLVVCAIRVYKDSARGLRAAGTIWMEKPPKDLNRKTRIPKDTRALQKTAGVEPAKLADVRLLVYTKPKESGIRKKTPEMFELHMSGSAEDKWKYALERLGKELKPEDVFAEGEWVDAKAVSTGKGYQGPVKRFGIKVRGRKHDKKMRHVGTLGPRNVARVLPGKIAMAGQLGFQSRTEYNKRILKLASGGATPKGGWLGYGEVRGDYMILSGSVPGPRKRLIILRKAMRPRSRAEPVELKNVSMESQQGV